MAGAITIDPMKCFESVNALIVGSTGYVLQTAHYPVVKAMYTDPISAGILVGMGEPIVLTTTGLMAYHLRSKGYSLWYPNLVQRVWQDCGGGGLAAAVREKLSGGLDKVGQKLFPNVKPAQELVPVRTKMVVSPSYAVSAEASYRRATSPTAIAKGLAIVGAATVVGTISAALYMLGMRNVPSMQAAPAGFGVTTDNSSSFLDRNQIL